MNSRLVSRLVRETAHSIAHAIAQGMTADYENFDRFNYLEQCSQLFTTLEIKPKYANQMVKLGHRWGVQEYYMMQRGHSMTRSIWEASTGAQIHPAETNIMLIAEELSDLLFIEEPSAV